MPKRPQANQADAETEAAILPAPVAVPAVHAANGRPYGITPEQQDAFFELVVRGHFVNAACQKVGIGYDVCLDWLRKGDPERTPNPVEPYLSFCRAYHVATIQAEEYALESLKLAFAKDWRAAAWFLSRKNKDWAEQKGVMQIGVAGGDVQIHLPDNGRDRSLSDD